MNRATEINITKRDGTKEPLEVNKMHFVVEQACEGLTGVSASQIEMNSQIQFTNNMSSTDIQDILIRSANDLITLENPNYQYAAARLLLWNIYKEVFGQFQPKPFIDIIKENVKRGVYDKAILKNYTETELKKLNTWIKHDRDLDFTYAGLRQVVDKYLVQDRSSGQVYETPQFMYMMIAATLFANYPQDTRLSYIK